MYPNQKVTDIQHATIMLGVQEAKNWQDRASERLKSTSQQAAKALKNADELLELAAYYEKECRSSADMSSDGDIQPQINRIEGVAANQIRYLHKLQKLNAEEHQHATEWYEYVKKRGEQTTGHTIETD